MIDREDTLFDITEMHPETIPVFVSNGFPQMNDPGKREAMGKSISLSSAMLLKQMDVESFLRLLEEAVKRNADTTDITLAGKGRTSQGTEDSGPSVVGILPCPVRLPLMEKWNDYLNTRRDSGGSEIRHELKAASMGLEWVQENLEGVDNPEDLPDLFISAGFDMFFGKKGMGRFRREGVFADLADIPGVNPDFAGLHLKDPERHYSIISVVPAMFLVNEDELGDREAPRSWEDILHPRFEKSVSLPVGDFDLFNAILLNIHKTYGDDGVRALGRSLLESMHPSQMVKSERLKNDKPSVTIMPYFFSKMVKEGSSLKAIWPEDGAVLSPIFMLAKASEAEEVKELVDFFSSEEIGNVLSGQGLFPSTHPKVKNSLPEGGGFMWLGWDYIAEHDLSELISHCEKLFDEAVGTPGKAAS